MLPHQETTDLTYLGTVENVRGATVTVSLNQNTASGVSFVAGHAYRIGQIGSFVRIPVGYVDLFGIVSEVGAGAVPESIAATQPYGHRWMTIQLVGESHRQLGFQRGISQYPTVGDQVHLVTEADLSVLYGHVGSPSFVRVGHLASSDSIPALLDLNKLVTRHSAVLGSTGVGKSTTVATILTALADEARYKSARILVLDIHGEYKKALVGRSNVFQVQIEPAVSPLPGQADDSAPAPEDDVSARPLFIPYWALTSDELLPITLGDLDDATRGSIIQEITELKSRTLASYPKQGVSSNTMTVDTPIPFSIHELWLSLYRLVHATHYQPGTGQSQATEALDTDSNGQPTQPGDALTVVAPKYRTQSQASGDKKIYLSASTLNITRQLQALASRLRDPRFDFLFRPGPWLPAVDGRTDQDLDSLLRDWIGGTQPITILDLSNVPYSILTHLIGVLLRIIYDALFWSRDLSEGGRERPLLVVLEEAHAYLTSVAGGSAAENVRRIVKEGRKYGIGAMVVSQRPSEIDPTILSQCGTFIAMRLSNTVDRSQVTSAATDNLEGLFAMLPALRIGEAVVVGEAVRLPIRALISAPPEGMRPDSEDPLVFDDRGPGGWNRSREPSDFAEVVRAWRQQDRRSSKLVPDTPPAKEEDQNA